MNFYECCDLTKKVYLVEVYKWEKLWLFCSKILLVVWTISKKYHSALILSFQKCKKLHLYKKDKRNLKISLSFFYLFIFHSTINLVRQRTFYTKNCQKNLYIIIPVCILPFVCFFLFLSVEEKFFLQTFFVDN